MGELDLIVLSGAPGSGKSTIGSLLRTELRSPLIDFGWLRHIHLAPDWHDMSEREEAMTFATLVFMLCNYWAHDFRRLIVNDLEDHRVRELAGLFADRRLLVVSLLVGDERELERRIVARGRGFRDVGRAVRLNAALAARAPLAQETRVDTAGEEVAETFRRVRDLVRDRESAPG